MGGEENDSNIFKELREGVTKQCVRHKTKEKKKGGNQ